MRQITSGELSRMRDAQESTFFDVCQIHVYSQSKGETGQLEPTWTPDVSNVRCSYSSSAFKIIAERQAEDMSVEINDAQLRLPFDVDVKFRDRIKVTTRFNDTDFVDLIFEVQGEAYEGPSQKVVTMRLTNPRTESVS